ncbi:hypothetical protein GCM10009621_12930 [Corynebacterium felinum]
MCRHQLTSAAIHYGDPQCPLALFRTSPQRVSHVLNELDSVDIHILANEGNIGAVHNVHMPIKGKNLVDAEYE